MKTILIIGLLVFAGYWGYKHYIKYPYRYVGYFYPSVENMSKWVESTPFSNIDECREWADEMADSYHVAESASYDYECGKDCYKGDPYGQGLTYTCNTSED